MGLRELGNLLDEIVDAQAEQPVVAASVYAPSKASADRRSRRAWKKIEANAVEVADTLMDAMLSLGMVKKSDKAFNGTRVLILGLGFRRCADLQEKCPGLTGDAVKAMFERAYRSRLWLANYQVNLGNADDEGFAVGLLLRGMVIAGELNIEWQCEEPVFSKAA